MFDLNNKIILLTGSSGGLGFTMARGLAKEGAIVILNGRNKEKLIQASERLKQEKISAEGFAFDVSDSSGVEDGIRKIIEKYGRIDVLVNNAAIQIRGPLEDFEEADWNQIINVNLSGAFIVSKQIVKGMILQKSGKIINICSLQSDLGRPTIAPYAASKGGLKMLTRAMATEWAKHNIQVNAIGPGYFKTEMTKSLYENPEFDSWLCSRTPSNRWVNPVELLGTMIFVA